MKSQLITSGFPRSGNTYLNTALNLFYYPDLTTNKNRHTVIAITKADKIIVPFRNPIDAIASWHDYPSQGQLHMDIAFYIRFHNNVLNNLNKIVLMDFAQFTTNLDYITSVINNNFNVSPIATVTDTQIKTVMIDNNLEINLPRTNNNAINETKQQLQTITEIEQCKILHEQLVEKAQL